MSSVPVKILIVDDEEALRELLTVRLEHWGYECRAASHVGEAERLITTFEPDVVLSDVVMPGVTGLDLLRRLRAAGRGRQPVVLMTAHGSIDTAVEAMKQGAVDFLTKPLDNDKLRAVLEDVTEELNSRRRAQALEESIERDGPLARLVGRSAPMMEL